MNLNLKRKRSQAMNKSKEIGNAAFEANFRHSTRRAVRAVMDSHAEGRTPPIDGVVRFLVSNAKNSHRLA